MFMFTFNQVMLLLLFTVVIILVGVILGGWLVFKSKNAVQGEGFLTGIPKGEVFHIPDANEDLENEAEKSVLTKVGDFMKVFGGGNAKN